MPTWVKATAGALAVALAVGAAYVWFTGRSLKDVLRPEYCRATVHGHTVQLSLDQAENAALMAAISQRRGLPARAVSIALATAYQESKILNIDYGDRDSIGLFQQRPSQGWGTRKQILDPHYSINAFYDALVKVRGYESMKITKAAQAVQRSAFPNAYADHERDARALASALTGNSRAAWWCSISADAETLSEEIDGQGLVPRAAIVREDLLAAFGTLSMGGFQPGGVSNGHMAGSTHYDGRAIDIFVRPISPDNKRRGWAIASYLVAHADQLDIKTVIFDDRIWQAGEDRWRNYAIPSSSKGDRKILEHRDHVHVDVFA